MISDAAIRRLVRKNLSARRWKHSLAVARLAARLAETHGWDREKAFRAGLLHDWAKEWPPAKLIAYVKKNRIRVPYPSITFRRPHLLHGYAGAHVAKRNGWITDPASLRAMAAHTLGAARMGTPEMVLYVADLASPDRRWAEAAAIRREAMGNLRTGFLSALAVKIRDVLGRRRQLHPLTLRVWNRCVDGVGSHG